MEGKLSPVPKYNFHLLGFPGSEGLAQAGEVKPAKVRREQNKPERAPLNCEQESTVRSSPVKHPTDKKRSSELITVKVVTAVVFFFLMLYLWSWNYPAVLIGKVKDFVLTEILASSAYSY